MRRHHLSADEKGFLYLVAIMTVHPKGSGLAHLQHAGSDFCVEALNAAVHKFGTPRVHEHGSGSQFTSFAWTDGKGVSAPGSRWTGKGRCLDNIFIERLWRSLKYECV